MGTIWDADADLATPHPAEGPRLALKCPVPFLASADHPEPDPPVRGVTEQWSWGPWRLARPPPRAGQQYQTRPAGVGERSLSQRPIFTMTLRFILRTNMHRCFIKSIITVTPGNTAVLKGF